LFFTTFSGYILGIKIKDAFFESKKKKLLFAGILVNIVILICFRDIFQSLIPAIGVSFFTFQNISYLIDCYLEKVESEKNFIYFSLYLAFFPKLLQGPIERADKLIPQLKKIDNYKYTTLRSGIQLFLLGMFKKVVIADNLGLIAGKILCNPDSNSGFTLLIAIYLYAIQIYCDFSGYTDMALGSAKLFGINLTNNFNYPYFSVSIQEFWRRWHITLSSWILDYIFRPLQMRWRNYGNYGIFLSLVITFFICGLWHGLTLNYIVWGIYHGIIISVSFITYKKWNKFCKKNKLNQNFIYFVDAFTTFHLVCFSWLIFIEKNLSDVVLISSKIFLEIITFSPVLSGLNTEFFQKLSVIFSFLFIIIEFLNFKFDLKTYFEKQGTFVRWIFYFLIVYMILLLAPSDETRFIYFQF